MSLPVLFLDAATEELINRYKITRRPHPLMGRSDSLNRAICQEREMLRQVKERADIVLDTTRFPLPSFGATFTSCFAVMTQKKMILW